MRESESLKARVVVGKVRLLAGQDFFIADDDLVDLLVRTLIKHADDEPHIDRMVDTWIARTRKPLHPADVAQLAYATSAKRPALPAGCRLCQGAPHVVIDEAVGAVRCPGPPGEPCARGAALRKMDEERKKSAPPFELDPFASFDFTQYDGDGDTIQ